MSSLLDVLQEKLSGKNVKIVLPEGEDERVNSYTITSN